MSVVSVAIVISFHLKSQPTSIEKRVALPVGLIFWLLSIACLASGLANYVSTVTKYSRRQALVQSGWKTQVVSIFLCIIHVSVSLAANGQPTGLHHCSMRYSSSLCAVFVYQFCVKPMILDQ